jgi:hypothetical protein
MSSGVLRFPWGADNTGEATLKPAPINFVEFSANYLFFLSLMHHLNQIIRTPSLPDQHYLQPLHFTLASSPAEKTVVDSNPVVRGVGSSPWWSGG